MSEYFSIGEMSKMHKVSIHTLRYYDQMGIFKPAYVDKENNYRYYTVEQFSQLDVIKYLKYLGMPLKVIRSKLDENNKEMLNLLENKIEIVDNKIRELELIKKVLETKKDIIEKGSSYDDVEKIKRKHIKSRSILSMVYKDGISQKDNMELSRRNIANIFEENMSIFYGGVGGLISAGDILKENRTIYKSSFVEVERSLFNQESQKYINEIPTGEFICMIYRGNYNKNYKYIKKLLDFVEYKIIPVEDEIYEVPIIDPISTSDENELLTELQIRVKRREIDLRCLV